MTFSQLSKSAGSSASSCSMSWTFPPTHLTNGFAFIAYNLELLVKQNFFGAKIQIIRIWQKSFLSREQKRPHVSTLKCVRPICLDEYLIQQPRFFIANTKTPASKEAVSRQQAIRCRRQRYRNQANPLFVWSFCLCRNCWLQTTLFIKNCWL